MKNALEQLADELRTKYSEDIFLKWDLPRDPEIGVWHLDIVSDHGKHLVVGWHYQRGFELYYRPKLNGDGPDETYGEIETMVVRVMGLLDG